MGDRYKGLNLNTLTSKDKKEFIKKILISAIKLKIKLNEQMISLNQNEVFPESLILDALNFDE